MKDFILPKVKGMGNDEMGAMNDQTSSGKTPHSKTELSSEKALRGRVKELSCLLAISEACQSGQNLLGIFQIAVDALSVAFLYPDITCARILFDGKIWKTANFQETRWCLWADLKVQGQVVGCVEVFYLEDRPAEDVGPFLEYEQSLLVMCAGKLSDVIMQQKLRGELQASTVILDKAQRLAHIGSWQLDLRTNVLTWSDEVFRIFGFVPQAFVPTYDDFLSCIHPEDRDAVNEAYAGSLGDGCNGYEIEHRIEKADTQEVRYVHERCFHERDDAGEIICSTGIVQDITEAVQRREAERFDNRFHTLASEISARFVRVNDSRSFDEAVDGALAGIGQLFGVDRSYLFRFSDDLSTMDNTHEWCAEGIEAQKHRIQQFPTDAMPWWTARMQEGAPVHIPDVAELPAEAETEKKEFQAQGVQSLLLLLIYDVSGKLIGFMGFDAVRAPQTWSEEQIAMLQVLAEIIGSAIGRLEAMNAVVESKNLLHSSIEALSYPFAVIKAETFEVEMANSAFGGQEAVGRKCHCVSHASESPCSENEHPCPIRQIKATGKPAMVEHVHQDRQGNTRSIEVHAYPLFDQEGKLVRVIECCYDITDRKRSEAEISEKTRLLQGVLDAIPDIVAIQYPDHRIEQYNKAGYDFLGMPHEQVSGKLCYSLIGRSEPCELCATAQALQTGVVSRVDRYLPEYGIHLECTSVPVFDDEGRITRIVELLHDITERKRSEAALLEANRQLERSSREALALAEKAEAASVAKTQFVANMSHELRTPMNGVLGFADLLRVTDLDAKQQKYVDTIISSGKSLLSVIEDILDFSKVEAGKVELEIIETDVHAMILETADMIECLTDKKGLSFHVDIDSALPHFALLDPLRLRQVLFNLLSNAVKFTGKGEVALTVTLANREGNSGRITFTVRDTGVGIPEANREHLFKAFSQGDNSNTRKYGGTGLGLVISDRLVQLMGGKIEYNSVVGEGTEFFFTLETDFVEPGKTTVHADASDENKAPEALQASRILIAEDDFTNMAVARAIIGMLVPGAEIIEASDGQDALDKIVALKPDLVLMDVQMPVMDGNEATARLRAYEKREKLPRTLVLGLTAHALVHEKEVSLSVGMDDYITKPIDARTIKAVLSKYLKPES